MNADNTPPLFRAAREFDAWAAYYDLFHEGLEGEAAFYVSQALRRGGPVLELGCGTGRVALLMAMSGVDVVGLDISAGMLALCKEKIVRLGDMEGTIALLRGDMRDFALNRKFPFIAMPYRSFMHLLTPEEQRDCLRCVRQHLAPGGAFIFNLWAARPSAITPLARKTAPQRPKLVEKKSINGGVSLRHYHSAQYEEFEQRIVEEHRIEEHDGQERLLHTETLRLTRAWATPREVDQLAHGCGFDVEAVLGDFEGQPLSAGSSEMIWILRRPQ